MHAMDPFPVKLYCRRSMEAVLSLKYGNRKVGPKPNVSKVLYINFTEV